jgi:hypothetical protein
MNSISRVFATVAASAALFLSNPSISGASPVKGKNKTIITESQVSVQYIGFNESSLIFRVQFENTDAKKFYLIIKNDAGDVVYESQFSDVHFSKAIHLPKVDGEIHPTFVIRTANSSVERSFSISRKYTENVEVTKL